MRRSRSCPSSWIHVNSVHQDIGSLRKNAVSEQERHCKNVRADWDEIWKAAIRRFVVPDLVANCGRAAAEFKCVLEELSVLYVAQLVDMHTLPKYALQEQHTAMAPVPAGQREKKSGVAATVNPFLNLISLMGLRVTVPAAGNAFVGCKTTWKPPCNVYGTDRMVSSYTADCGQTFLRLQFGAITARQELFLAGFAECMNHLSSGDNKMKTLAATSVHRIAYEFGLRCDIEFAPNFFPHLVTVQNKFLDCLWESTSFHRRTYQQYVSVCTGSKKYDVVSLLHPTSPVLIPIPLAYTAYVIDLLLVELQGVKFPFEIERYHRVFQPYPASCQVYQVWSKYDLPTPSRDMLLRDDPCLRIELESKGLLEFVIVEQ